MAVIAKRNHIKRRISVIITTVAVIAAMLFFQDIIRGVLGDYFIYPFIGVIAIAVIADILDILRYSTTSIEVSEKAVIYRTGILTKKEITYPYHKIANTRTQVTITDRIFGTMTLMVDTAGESNLDLTIHDLPAKACEQIYDEINGRMGKIKLTKGNDEA